MEEVAPDGNAAKQGSIKMGDVVIRCSATVLKSGKYQRREIAGIDSSEKSVSWWSLPMEPNHSFASCTQLV